MYEKDPLHNVFVYMLCNLHAHPIDFFDKEIPKPRGIHRYPAIILPIFVPEHADLSSLQEENDIRISVHEHKDEGSTNYSKQLRCVEKRSLLSKEKMKGWDCRMTVKFPIVH
ncbi:MAG: hypothetical protein LBL16_04270 [Endomicrobium sp.]|nr:hypothetical protein [Endomicrobium sp.]